MEKKIQYLLDRLAIEDQIIRYASIIDGKRFDDLEEVFTSDAFIDYRASGGEAGTVAEMSDFLKRSMASVRSQHLMSNVVCEISEDRQSATSRVMLFNPMTMDLEQGEYSYFCGLFYDQKWRMCGETWKMYESVQSYSYMHRPVMRKKKAE